MAIENNVAEMIDVATGRTFDIALSAPGGVLPVVSEQWVVRREESGFWAFDRCVARTIKAPQKSFSETMTELTNRGLINPSYADGTSESYTLANIGQIRWFAIAYTPNDRWLRCDGAQVSRSAYRELAHIIDPLGTTDTFTAPLVADAETVNKTTWATLPFSGAWTHYDPTGASFEFGEYRRKGDTVELHGLVNSATAAQGQQIAQLPVGFRPTKVQLFPSMTNNAIARVDINPDGTIWYTVGIAGPAGAWVALDNLRFYSPTATTITVRPYVCARK